MPSSLILQGGLTGVKTLEEKILQANTFAIGDVVRWDASQAKYVLAKADSAINAEVAGVVKSVNHATDFTIVYSGIIVISTLDSSTDPVQFLSDSVAGGLSPSPPSAIGSIVKPILTKNTNGSGYIVMNYLGTQIGGSSTISVDEIQPVGSIMPFAGTAIPDTWLECNGNSYAVSDYPHLYDKLLYAANPKVPMYGSIIRIDHNPDTAVNYAGDILLFRSGVSSTWTGTYSTDVLYAELIGTVIFTDVTADYILVDVKISYDTATQTLFNHNRLFENGSRAISSNSYTGNYIHYTATGGSRSISSTYSNATVSHFKTPDLRGRFTLGMNPALIADNTLESDTTYNSELDAVGQGVYGGSESIGSVTNVATWNATSAEVSVTNSSAVIKPPYLTTKYIIKAKPYTRAAIIDGVDIPYTSLLVGDLRSGTLRGGAGTGDDLSFKTNQGNNLGTEKMVLKNDGSLFLKGCTTSTVLTGVNARGTIHLVHSGTADSYGGLTISSTVDANKSQGGILLQGSGSYGTKMHFLTTENYSVGQKQRMIIDQLGNVGIGIVAPGATLDVDGTLRVGNFGGATNVMPKPNLNSSAGVGHIIPLFSYGGAMPTTYLSEGKWFVYLVGSSNVNIGTNSTSSEDPVVSAAFVVSVETGKYFTMCCYHDSGHTLSRVAAHDARSGVMYQMITGYHGQTANTPIVSYVNVAAGSTLPLNTITGGAGWEEFTESSASPFKSMRYGVSTNGAGTHLDSHSMNHFSSFNFWVMSLQGYAIRIE